MGVDEVFEAGRGEDPRWLGRNPVLEDDRQDFAGVIAKEPFDPLEGIEQGRLPNRQFEWQRCGSPWCS